MKYENGRLTGLVTSKKLLDDLKDRRGYSHLKEEALDLSSDRMLNNNLTGYIARKLGVPRSFGAVCGIF